MINLRKPDLGLSGINLSSSILLFDGKNAVSGNHLRWNFNPEMGFPKKGFTIQRYSYDILVGNGRNNSMAAIAGNTFNNNSSRRPEWELKINLPVNKREALSRIREVVLSSSGLERFDEPSEDLMGMINKLKSASSTEDMYNVYLSTSEVNGLKTGLRLMDILLMASIDPYVARMLGLYAIDTTADPTKKYFYIIQGHWETASFPLIKVQFENFTIHQTNLPLQFGDIKVIPDKRTVGVLSKIEAQVYLDSHLLVVGELNPGFEIEFDFLIEEISFRYEMNEQSGDWTINVDGEPITYIDNGDWLRITRRGNGFQRINFKIIPGHTLRFYNVNYRRRVGSIGNKTNYMVLDPTVTNALTVPDITRLETEQMPAILNEVGEVTSKISQVKVSSFIETPKISEILIPEASDGLKVLEEVNRINNPVRIQFSRFSKETARTVLPSQLKNIESPSIYRESITDIDLPSLLGYWPFDAQFKNAKDGLEPKIIGQPQFVKSDREDKSSDYVLKFKGKEALVLENQEHLKALSDNFTLAASINISHLCGDEATIIGNKRNSGFWWGIVKQTNGLYKSRLIIKNITIDGTVTFPIDRTLQLSITYNGSVVNFYYGGFGWLNLELPKPAAHGKLEIPSGNMTIGADNGSTNTRLISPFFGQISKVSIWQQVIHPSERTYQLTKGAPFLSQQQLTSGMIYRGSRTYLLKSGQEQILLEKTPALMGMSHTFSIFLWIKPDGENNTTPTLIGNDFNNGFRISLLKSGNLFHLRAGIKSNLFHSRTNFGNNKWTHLGVSYNGSVISLYIDGKLDSSHSTTLGLLSNENIKMSLGSELMATSGTTVQFPYNGFINDIQFWRVALTIDQWREKMGGIQLADKFLENHTYHYGAQAIDLFGRISRHGKIKKVKTNAIPEYNPPVNLHAKFKPISGNIVSIEPIIEIDRNTRNETKKGYTISTDISHDNALRLRLIGYDLTIQRLIDYEVPDKNGVIEQVERLAEQSFEINKVKITSTGSFFQFNVKAVPFEQLIPQVDDKLNILFDYNYELKWGWTGIQQLYNNGITSFKLFQAVGIQNELSKQIEVLPSTPASAFTENQFKVKVSDNTIGFLANELNEKNCLIGPHKFKIVSHTAGANPEFKIEYKSEPLITPKNGDLLRISIPEGTNGYKNLEENIGRSIVSIPAQQSEPLITSSIQTPEIVLLELSEREFLVDTEKIDWLPDSKVYKITVSNFTRPPGYIREEPKDYLPGALVFFDEGEGQNKWRSFYVIWHKWVNNIELILYTTPGEKDEVLPTINVTTDHSLRLYLGERFHFSGILNALPEFSNGKTTAQYHLALKAEDSAGIQSNLSRGTVMVAVNRKRPPEPPTPLAEILDKADYYGKSKVAVSWDPPDSGESLFYKIFRATDSDIYTRDLEQRRTRQGFYKKYQYPLLMFEDDIDFSDWLQTLNLPAGLDLFPAPDSAAWREVTPIWRKWADRFFPALDNDQLQEIAERAGNERAFKLLTGKPIPELSYLDEINAVIRNRYYYRLKTMNEALSESAVWGGISLPVVPIVVKPPRKPVFTKVEAGDREVTLHWSLNREPDFREYILYRAENRGDLEDLRWWSNERDTRIVDRIPDPRIRTLNNEIQIPSEFSIARITGVYRLDEFDKEANPIVNQPEALNFYTVSSEFEISTDASIAHGISGLRKIADGISVAVVYEDAGGEIQYLVQQHELIPFTDAGLVGLRDYYYRLVGVNINKLTSDGSAIQIARSAEVLPPPMPAFEMHRENISSQDSKISFLVTEQINDLQIMIKRKQLGEFFWSTVIEWVDLNYETPQSNLVQRDIEIEFCIMVRTKNKKLNVVPIYFYSSPV